MIIQEVAGKTHAKIEWHKVVQRSFVYTLQMKCEKKEKRTYARSLCCIVITAAVAVFVKLVINVPW